jgi:hypothetical protein
MMDRDKMLEMWTDQVKEGNWIPSWTDSLAGLTAEEAAWTPGKGAHSIWQEVVHVIFWRHATIAQMSGGSGPSSEEVNQREFALPDRLDEESWAETVAELNRTHGDIAVAIQDPEIDVSRVPYHLLHDAYHLGRITHLRAMQGTPPRF